MNDLNLQKYKRVFTFGCSFTRYIWATWADIIGYEIGIEKLYNFGKSGAGNYFICNSIMEADQLYNLTSDDLVMVMFTNPSREDRIVQGRWISPGNIYSQNMYDSGFMKYWDDTHGLLRDLSLIKMVTGFLKSKNIDFHLMSMVPIDTSMGGTKLETPECLNDYVLAVTKDIKPSILEVIFNGNWHSIQPRSITKSTIANHPIFGNGWYEDNHGHPKDYLEYLLKLWPETKFSTKTIDQVDMWHQEVLDSKVRKQFIITDSPKRFFY